jgi:hypothetical protein
MATIYSDQHNPLKLLLGLAGMGQEATLLIPNLQRPYVWQPAQVVVLIDSLIRGWPFGTLLTWKVASDDAARGLARPFWGVIDRVDEEEGTRVGAMHPPASFHMVLDGQQRIQSLLLALGEDGWGFKLLDRQWHEHLSGRKPRGARGKNHWSLGCLCVEVPALQEQFSLRRRATAIDYSRVLKWVVTDVTNGQSTLPKPGTYIDPLPIAAQCQGRFIRLSRLWRKTPDQSIDNYEAEELADALLADHGAMPAERAVHKRALGSLLIALREVKETRVTYLELSPHDQSHGDRGVYNDAIVNIFTRLNTAGRTLTREDITFAWLQVGWNKETTESKGAKACIDALAAQLAELGVPASAEDVIASISFVWSTCFYQGKLLTNDDLMRGEAIRPMAADVSAHWHTLVEAMTRVSARIKDRDLVFRDQYQSINSLSYLWTWYFAALKWANERGLSVVARDSLDKHLAGALEKYVDRWLIGSQWAGVWATASGASLAKYASNLASCSRDLESTADVGEVAAILGARLEADIKGIEQAAVDFLAVMNADDRNQVRVYYTALWLWNRLDAERWKSAELGLKDEGRRKPSIEVDHIVAWDLWRTKLEHSPVNDASGAQALPVAREDLMPRVNELGNCMLLKKNFNISKSNATLKSFLDRVHEFCQGELEVETWATALSMDMAQVDCASSSIELLLQLFTARSQQMRSDLEEFIRGVKGRVDLV